MTRTRTYTACFLAVSALAIPAAVGQTFLGAAGALKAIRAPAAEAPKPPKPSTVLRKSIYAYRDASRTLAPSESARQWLSLVDRCDASNPIWALDGGESGDSLLSEVMGVLPSPTVWPEIERLLRDRLAKSRPAKDRLLLAMVETLRGDRSAAAAEVEGTKGLSLEQSVMAVKVSFDLALLDRKPDQVAAAYLQMAKALNSPTQPIGGEKSIDLPDLSAMLGEADARALLVRLLEDFDGELLFKGGNAFLKMARELATEEVAKLKHPQWTLAIDVDSDEGRLFEGLRHRFPNSRSGTQQNVDWASTSYYAAATRFVVYLVARGRDAEASKLYAEQDNDYWFASRSVDAELPLLRRTGKTDAFLRFFEGLISSGKADESVSTYRSICVEVGARAREEKFIAKLKPSLRAAAKDSYGEDVAGLVARGLNLEAGKLLADEVKAMKANDPRQGYPNVASKLVDLGRALQRPDWIELGIKKGEEMIRSADFGSTNDWVCFDLQAMGHGPEAESLIADVLQKRTHAEGTSSPPAGEQELVTLIRLYAKAERWADVLTILEEAPNLGKSDVALLETNERGPDSLPFITAEALAAVGRRAEALHVLDYVLRSEPDLDEGYALLLKLDAAAAEPWLDRMHHEAPMATRPLMWEAELLRRQSRLPEAERTVRRAIALDPEDSSGISRGTRFQGYAILADIEKEEGETDQAARDRHFFDNPGKPTYWQGSGAITLDVDGPARRLRALVHNPNDFVIRFQIADDLKALGKQGESDSMAAEACRSMVANLGPAGSAEGFDNEEDSLRKYIPILADEISRHPDLAGAYVALAVVYRWLDNSELSAKNYLRAVQVDPDCLSAWEGLEGLVDQGVLSQEILDRTGLALARLRPHPEWRREYGVRNFAEIWAMADPALRDIPPITTPIFALPASKPDESSHSVPSWEEQNAPPSAGGLIASDRTIMDFIQLIGSIRTPTGVKR